MIHRGVLQDVGPTHDLIKRLTHREVCFDLVAGNKNLSHPLLVEQTDTTKVFSYSFRDDFGYSFWMNSELIWTDSKTSKSKREV